MLHRELDGVPYLTDMTSGLPAEQVDADVLQPARYRQVAKQGRQIRVEVDAALVCALRGQRRRAAASRAGPQPHKFLAQVGIDTCSLNSLRDRLIKTEGRLVRHSAVPSSAWPRRRYLRQFSRDPRPDQRPPCTVSRDRVRMTGIAEARSSIGILGDGKDATGRAHAAFMTGLERRLWAARDCHRSIEALPMHLMA